MPRTRTPELTNRDILNKIENDISMLRGEVLRLSELVNILVELKKRSGNLKVSKKSWGLF